MKYIFVKYRLTADVFEVEATSLDEAHEKFETEKRKHVAILTAGKPSHVSETER